MFFVPPKYDALTELKFMLNGSISFDHDIEFIFKIHSEQISQTSKNQMNML